MPSSPSTSPSSGNNTRISRSSSYPGLPDAPDGYVKLCILKHKLTDDENILSAQNGIVLFGRSPPDEDDIEHERRILYIPTGENNRKLTTKELSDMVLSAIYHSHIHSTEGDEDVPRFKWNSRIAGLWYEPIKDGKAAFVPLCSIVQNPNIWCETDRDYYVLNPDVMEDELTLLALETWKQRLLQFFSIACFFHLLIWFMYGFSAGLIFVGMVCSFVFYIWTKDDIQLPNGVGLREKLIDEIFFLYDYITDAHTVIQCTVISTAYLYMTNMHFQVFGMIIGGFHSVAWTVVRHFYRWRWGLQRLETQYFEPVVNRLSQVCEELTMQDRSFWKSNMDACISIFATYERNFLLAFEKTLVFSIVFMVTTSLLHSNIVGPVFAGTRSAWPYFIIYGLVLIIFVFVFNNSGLDLFMRWDQDLVSNDIQTFVTLSKKVLSKSTGAGGVSSGWF